MLSVAGIVVSLILLVALSFRGLSVLLIAPVAGLMAAALSDAPLLASYTQVFMRALGSFAALYFPLFLLGALFGRLMEQSGAAKALALALTAGFGGGRHAIVTVVLTCALLTYGGVSLFVVAFAVFPIAEALFLVADKPKRLIPAAIALGAFTFTMSALPGSPSIQNAIPMPYFGTTLFAAPGLGLLAAAIMLGGGLAWLLWRQSGAQGFADGIGILNAPEPVAPDGAPASHEAGHVPLPSVYVAAVPIGVLLVLNYVMSTWWLPHWDATYLAETLYGEVNMATVKGLWSLLMALLVAIALLFVMARRTLNDAPAIFNAGALSSLAPIFNTASLVGYGAVIASLSGFEAIRDALLSLGTWHPLVSLSVSMNVLAGITGSASGGMSIALQTLGENYAQMAIAAGIAPDLLHRVTTLATGGLDALPHNGAVITLLTVCGLSHRQSYMDIGVVAVLIPMLALVAVVVMGSLWGSF